MNFELTEVKDFYSHFGDGYCMELPTGKPDLDAVLKFLSAQKAQWRFYATLYDGEWFHGMHITFQNKKFQEVEPVMQKLCRLAGTTSYGVYEGYTQTVMDIDGDIIAFSDFTEAYE